MRIAPPLRSMLLVELLLAASLIAVIASPLSLTPGSITDLDGKIWSVDNWDRIRTLPLPQMIVYLTGDVNCHQQADRSFLVNDNQLPICARDTGILSGMVIGLGAFMRLRKQVPWTWLLILLVPMAMDGGLQAISSYESNNIVRALTGAVAGAAVGWGAGMIIERFFASERVGKTPSKGEGQT